MLTQIFPTPEMTRKPRKTRFKTNKLSDAQIANRYRRKIEEGLAQFNCDELDLDTLYNHMTNSLLMAGEKVLGVT